MTPETARLLAQALTIRHDAGRRLRNLLVASDGDAPPSDPVWASIRQHAATYVHEERIINRIVSEDTDE